MKKLEDLKRLETLSQTMNELKKLGFTHDFVAKDGAIRNLDSGEAYEPENVIIIETFRFEGLSNPADNALLLALQCKDGKKGSLVSSYSAKHSQQEEIVQRLKMKEERS